MILTEKKHGKLKRTLFIAAFLAIPLIHFCVFWLYINIDTIRLTFFTYAKGSFKFIGFENYVDLFKDIFMGQSLYSQRSFWNSFHAIAINLIILPLSIITAYAFYKKIPATGFFRVIFYLPSIISLVILATAFRHMFRQDFEHNVFGPIASILDWMGIQAPGGAWLNFMDNGAPTFWPLVYIFCILNGLGTNVILISSAMNRIPTEVSEAAKLDGCGFFYELTHVTLPLVMPTITTWVMVIWTSVFGFYLQPMLIVNNTSQSAAVMTSAWQIFNAAQDPTNYRGLIGAATLGILLSLFILPFNLISRAVLKKYTVEVTY